MSHIFCVVCQKNVETEASRFKKWSIGEITREGWGCHKHWQHMKEFHEAVDDTTKENRVKYAGDTIQQWRQGELSREFIKRHPKRIKEQIEKGSLTPQQVKKSKNVWSMDVKGLE